MTMGLTECKLRAALVVVGLALVTRTSAVATATGSISELAPAETPVVAAARLPSLQCQDMDRKLLATHSTTDIFRDAVGGAGVACTTVHQEAAPGMARTVLFARNPVDVLVPRLLSEWKQQPGFVPLDVFADAFLSAQPDNPMARFLLSVETQAGATLADTGAADGHLQNTDYLQARAILTRFQHLVFQDTLQDSMEVLRFALDPTSSPRNLTVASPPSAKQPARTALRGLSRLANFADLDLMQVVWRNHRATILNLLAFDMMLYQDMRLLAHQRASGALTRCRAAATRCPVTQSLVQLSIRLRP